MLIDSNNIISKLQDEINLWKETIKRTSNFNATFNMNQMDKNITAEASIMALQHAMRLVKREVQRNFNKSSKE